MLFESLNANLLLSYINDSFLVQMSFPFLVKAPNKKAEKSKKSTLKNSNSITEGDRQYSSIKEGE